MKALIIGATGLVGHCIWKQWRQDRGGWTVSGTYRERPFPEMEALDIRNESAVGDLLKRAKPDAIVLTASNPFVDYCQTHPQETRRVNVEGTLNVARAAKKSGAKFVFFSSDYVFDGSKAPYSESDPLTPMNEYGKQKVEAERAIAAAIENHLILRISGAFGWEIARKNFVLQILDRTPEKGPVLAARDVRYNPTYAFNIPGVLKDLVKADARGIYHVVGKNEFTRYDFAAEVVRVFGLDPARVKAVMQKDLGSPTPRPSYSSLRIDKVQKTAKSPLWGAAEALEHMRAETANWEKYVYSLSSKEN